MSKLIEQIDKAQCLILDKRYIEWISTTQLSFINKGINLIPFIAGNGKNIDLDYNHIDLIESPPITKFTTKELTSWRKYPNAYNAYLCHKKMIEQALLEKRKNLLIVEDDAFIENDFDEILEEAESFLLQSKWDMIYFGAYHKNTSSPMANNYVRQVNGSAGFHCVLIHNRIFDLMLEYGPIGPMDEVCNKFIHQTHKCYAIYPSIVTQKSGYSYIEHSQLEKPSRWEL
jgi:hypothetical protein